MSFDKPVQELTRRETLLGMIQAEFPSYHPLIAIARIAHLGDADLKLQFECHRTIAKYVEPELKSLEVKGEINGRHKVSVSLFEPQVQFSPIPEHSKIEDLGSRPNNLPVIDVESEVIDRVVASGW